MPQPNPKRWRGIIARAYPRSSPGHLTHLRSRGARMRLQGKSKCTRAFRRRKPTSCQVVVWVPNSKRPKVGGRNLIHIQKHRQTGGWTVTATVKGNYTLRTR